MTLNQPLKVLAIAVLFLIITVFSTAVIIIGSAKYTFMLAGGLIGLFFFVMPPQWLLSVLMLYAFLILGPISSLAGIDTNWIPYLMGLGLLFQAILYQISQKKKDVNHTKDKIPAYLWSLLIFITIAIFATATGLPNSYTLQISIRNLFFFWGVYFILISYSNFSPNFFRILWLFFLAMGILQLPMVIYQRLILSSVRTDSTYWDSVIGTFPGDKLAGDSGGMAFFLIATATMAVSIWRHGQLNGKFTLLIIGLLIAPIFFGEIKVSYLLMPIMAALIFREELKKNPLKFITGMLIAIILIIGVYLAGKHFNSKTDELNKPFDLNQEYQAVFGYSLDKDNWDGNVMGRFTLLNFWWDKNKNEPLRLTLGYGLGSGNLNNAFSNSGSEGWKYRPVSIANTLAASLLWDSGIFGLLAYTAIHIFGAMRAAKLAKNIEIPPFHQAMLFAASAIIIAKITLIPYQVSSATTQAFFFLLLGMVGYWDKQMRLLSSRSKTASV